MYILHSSKHKRRWDINTSWNDVSQIQKAVDNGAVEVALLGQNVNSYGKRFSDNREI